MHATITIRAVMLFTVLMFPLVGLAQTLDFDVLVDTDSSAVSGCSVAPSGGAALDGFERRVRASLHPASFEIIALEQPLCADASFGAPVLVAAPVPRPTAP